MKKAIVTGASSGIGAAIAAALIRDDYEVYGIGRDYKKQEELTQNPMFRPLVCDLKRHTDVEHTISDLRKEAGHIHVLVNCAGVGYFGPHEQINPDRIHEMVAVNVEAPMIITGLLLRDMKKNGGLSTFHPSQQRNPILTAVPTVPARQRLQALETAFLMRLESTVSRLSIYTLI